MNPLFRKRFIYCAMVIPFILHWPSLFFYKVSNSWKKVLITPSLYFPNYCVMYLPCDISCDFKVWTREHRMRVNRCSIRGVVIRCKQSEDSWQKEGRLSRRFREEPCWQCSMKPWQLHERPREKSCTKPQKLHEESQKRVVLTVQHEAAKVNKKDLEKSRWNETALAIYYKSKKTAAAQ